LADGLLKCALSNVHIILYANRRQTGSVGVKDSKDSKAVNALNGERKRDESFSSAAYRANSSEANHYPISSPDIQQPRVLHVCIGQFTTRITYIQQQRSVTEPPYLSDYTSSLKPSAKIDSSPVWYSSVIKSA